MPRYDSQPAFPATGFSQLPPSNRFTRTFSLRPLQPPPNQNNPAVQLQAPTTQKATAQGLAKLANGKPAPNAEARPECAQTTKTDLLTRRKQAQATRPRPQLREAPYQNPLLKAQKRADAAMPAAPAPGPANIAPAMGGPTMQPPQQPMAAPPTPPADDVMQTPLLPANPRMTPPRPFGHSDAEQLAVVTQLLQDKNQQTDETPTDDLNDELMAVGGKIAALRRNLTRNSPREKQGENAYAAALRRVKNAAGDMNLFGLGTSTRVAAPATAMNNEEEHTMSGDAAGMGAKPADVSTASGSVNGVDVKTAARRRTQAANRSDDVGAKHAGAEHVGAHAAGSSARGGEKHTGAEYAGGGGGMGGEHGVGAKHAGGGGGMGGEHGVGAKHAGDDAHVGTIWGASPMNPPAHAERRLSRFTTKGAADSLRAAGLTPFAVGFVLQHLQAGCSFAATKTAAEKAAAEFGGEVARELGDGMQKLAAGFNPSMAWGMARQAFGKAAPMMQQGAKKMFAGATQNPSGMLGQARRQLGASAGGAIMGGFAGPDAVGTDAGTINLPFGFQFSAPGAAAGAAAFNPTLRRLTRRNAAAAPLLGGVRGRMIGGAAGSAADQLASGLGVEGTQFSRAGANLGTLAGVGGGAAGVLARRAPAGSMVGQAARSGATALNRLNRGGSEFVRGSYEPSWSAMTYPLRAAKNYVTGAGRPQFLPQANTASRRLGRLVGGGTAALGGVAAAGNMLQDRVESAVDDNVARVYGAVVPQAAQDVSHLADSFLQSRGFTNAQGRIDPTGMMLSGLTSRLDPVLAQFGLNPATLSPAQKLTLLGGSAGLAGGAALGSPLLAGLGGAAMMGGAGGGELIQSLLQRIQQSGDSPQARNEYLHQLQLAQQQQGA